MDFDLEIGKNEGNHSTPLYSSIINAMTSMKEATAEKIYRRIKKEGITNYSKPQVDRALANALKYGIFELRNNRYRVRDDVLDDEDTIYWKADIKHEETPHRLDSNRGDYINPEKDRRTFRRLSIDENGGSKSKKPRVIVNEITVRKGKIVHKNNKTRQGNNTCRKTQRSHVPKEDYAKKGKTVGKRGACPPKYKETEKKIPQRTIRKLTVEDEKKIRRVSKSGRNRRNGIARYEKINTNTTDEPVCECNYEVIMRDSYEIDCNCEEKNTENESGDDVNQKDNDEDDEGEDGDEDEDEDQDTAEDGDECEEDEEEDEDEDEDEDEEEDENEDEEEDEDEDDDKEDYHEESKTTFDTSNREPNQCASGPVRSFYFNYMKRPLPSNISLITKTNTSSCKCNFQTEASSTCDNDCWSSTDKTQENFSDLNLDCSDMESNLLNEWCAKAERLGNRPQNTLDGTVKHFDNALKIEPMDPLPFKNIEEPSYIS